MKKFLSVLLALIMVVSFAACGSDSSNDANKEENTDKSTQTDAVEQTNPEEDEKPEKLTPTFSEELVIDEELCSVKITGIDPDNMWGYTLKAEIENKSSDKTLMFSTEHASINGVYCNTFFASEVAPGKKAKEEINFTDDFLKENNVKNYTDIAVTFRIYDSEDWLADDVVNKTVHIYPYGEDKASAFVREAKATDTVVADNENFTFIVTGYDPESDWGYEAKVFIVNKTDKTLMFSADEASVNGFMLDPFFAAPVYANECRATSINWAEDSLEESEITEIETIEFKLNVTDAEDWTADPIYNEAVTLNP